MPLKFAYLCNLLEELEKHEVTNQKLPAKDRQNRARGIVKSWFQNHKQAIDSSDATRIALLSSLFPERRTDRVYNLKARALLNLLSRSLGLGAQRGNELRSWKETGTGDLASWASRIVKATDTGAPSAYTIEAIDGALEQVASRARFSSPQIRARMIGRSDLGAHEFLGPIARHLPSHELKWLIRLILKDFSPVVLEENFLLQQVHILLPRLLQFQSTFDAAVRLLRSPLLSDLSNNDFTKTMAPITTPVRLECLRPSIGVKIGRPIFIKARSIKQCLQITRNSRWSVEPKIDGEYCQVHVDLSKGDDCLQIFAKSGKDATGDRKKLHGWIKKCLKIGTTTCQFKQVCILEGEMVVRSDRDRDILPFHKIRKHVSRSGSFLGTELDSQAHPHEQLIMIFYDALLVDDEVTMGLPYDQRKERLSQLLHIPSNRRNSSFLAAQDPEVNQTNWDIIDFAKCSTERAAITLSQCLADAVANRCEGLVLKPCDSPYFSFGDSVGNAGKFIKLKKDYIKGLGDTADFVIIGAARDLNTHLVGNLKWTHFTIACLENKDDVLRFQRRPRYRVMGSLSRPCISSQDMEHISRCGQSFLETTQTDQSPSAFDVLQTQFDARIDVWFTRPFIADVLGSGFDKPASRDYYMLRHPRITKLHSDRGLEDVVSFRELQELADRALKLPPGIEQEEADWLEKIKAELKPNPKVFACSRSPFSEATTTDSWVTNRTTPTRQSRSRAPLMVRMDSIDMQPGDQRLVSTKNGSATVESPNTRYSQSSVGDNIVQKNNTCSYARAVEDRRIQAAESAAPETSCTVTGVRHQVRRSDDTTQTKSSMGSEVIRGSTALTELENMSCSRSKAQGARDGWSKSGKAVDITPSQRVTTIIAGLRGGAIGAGEDDIYSSASKRKANPCCASIGGSRNSKRPRTSPNVSTPLTEVQFSNRSEYFTAPTVLPSETSPGMPSQSQQLTPKSSGTRTKRGEDMGSDRIRLSPSPNPSPTASTHSSSAFHPFKNSTIYLNPSVSPHPYVTQTLLPLLSPAHITSSLSHWIRLLHPPELYANSVPLMDLITPNSSPSACQHGSPPALRAATIAESQFAPHLRKIMLVESRMVPETRTSIDRVVSEMDLAWERGEQVEVWDWRALEVVAGTSGRVVGYREAAGKLAGDGGGGAKEWGTLAAAREWKLGVVRWNARGGANEFVGR